MDKQKQNPSGFALGSIEGRVAIQYLNPTTPKDNFTFKCHRSNAPVNGYHEIFAVSIVYCAIHIHENNISKLGNIYFQSLYEMNLNFQKCVSALAEHPIGCKF
ncbi:Poly(A)+ RNA export protein rae1, variant 4 [Schistosoma haematobium]|uniref:Poly(A)+ RNA export protein rae1, variant 4 n=1 Tax=Schistosoma haematobium TaxID=6185 RepID=A0A922LRR2_SCHHA|nr:Poly(A)+ RNA export protein rae1, variant 4 [Schistosoma haematobium]KAH9592050.1 Poly(A)+ RNA export protein rae1, variant 4 [Schistosoma haematobium]